MWSGRLVVVLSCLVWIYISPQLGSCVDNVALHKPAWLSSMHTSASPPSAAVDGRISKKYREALCIHTEGGDTSPWLVVDLLGEYQVTTVFIYNRQDCCQDRLHDFVIEVFDTNPVRCESARGKLCMEYTGVFDRDGSFQCNATVQGRFVRLSKPVTDTVLNICELEVYGTKTDCGGSYYRRINGKRLDSFSTISRSGLTRTACVSTCEVFGACMGVNYNAVTGVCEHLTHPEPGDAVTDHDDWIYYGQDFC